MPFVYVLTNPAMPGLVKIGRTSGDDAGLRIVQLYSSGVPFPFRLEFACKVPNAEEVEQALHRAFAPNRVNPKREFFSIDPEQAIAILRLLHVEDATAEIGQATTPIQTEEVRAGEEYEAARRPNLNFVEMGIPVGSSLTFEDGETTVSVVAPRKVRLGEDEMSLTKATRKLLGLSYSVQPGPHWMFNGRSLREIYNETYPLAE